MLERPYPMSTPAARSPRSPWRRMPLVAAVGAGLLMTGALTPAGASHDGARTTVEPFDAAPDGTPVER